MERKSQVQIPKDLLLALFQYHLAGNEEYLPEIEKALMEKLDSMVKRQLYTTFKTAPTEEEREKVNQIENYKYRVMCVGYGIAGYPVKVVLEQDIADELNNKEDSGYIYTIDSKTEFEELLVSVFNSKTMQKIIQNLITASNRKLLEQKEAQEDC